MDDDGILRSPKWIRAHDVDTRLKWAKVPHLYRGPLEGRPPPGGDEEAWLSNYERGQLLLFQGTNGVQLANRASFVLGRLAHLGESVRWVSSEGYVELYKEEWTDDDEGDRWRELKYITRAYDALVIDGLGEEPNTEFERKILASLIKGRAERCLTTIIVSPLRAIELGTYSGRVGHFVANGTTITIKRTAHGR